MTVLELMVVLAIIAGAVVLVRSGFRLLTKADLVECSTELAAIMKRAGQLAIEKGEMHRVVFDLDKQIYAVEVCQGARTIARNEQVRADAEAQKRGLEKGQERLRNIPTEGFASDPDVAAKQALAIAGHHIADRTCMPVDEKEVSGLTGGVDTKTKDAEGNTVRTVRGDKDIHTNSTWIRALRVEKGIKFKEIWVQHKDDSTTKGQIAVYFFPTGSSEKAVIELTDDSETFSVLVHGLTGRIQLKDGVLRDVNDHMLRNVMGDKEAERDADGDR
jgi:hypothetical protein